MLAASVGGAGKLELSGKSRSIQIGTAGMRSRALGPACLALAACAFWLALPATAQEATPEEPPPADAASLQHAAVEVTIESGRSTASPNVSPAPAPETSPGPAAAAEEATRTDAVIITEAEPEAAPRLDSAEDWMEDQVVAVESALREAHFRSAQSISAQLRVHPSANDSQRVRLEQAHAIACVALGEEDNARASFQRLLSIDPGFAPGDHNSPKVHRAFEAARRTTALQ